MNERDSKMLYAFKNVLIKEIETTLKKCQRQILTSTLEHIINQTVETFLHPSEERKQPHA